MNESEIREIEWLRREAALAQPLTDEERTAVLEDLLKTADAIRAGKSAEELRRDEKTRRILEDEPGKRRYLAWIARLAGPPRPVP